MLRSDGWTETAMHRARRCQQIEQNLTSEEAPRCELREETIGGITQGWMADPEGVDQRRAEMATLVRRLLHNGLSRYEPSPERACEAAEQRKRDNGAAERGLKKRRPATGGAGRRLVATEADRYESL